MTPRKDSKVGEVLSLRLEDLTIGKAQVRSNANKGIEELAHSIKTLGLLEPIVVTKVGESKYEILTGQRRFLAHKMLEYEEIQAVVVDRKIDETQAKVISLTENLVREDLSLKEKIDACTSLYRIYGDLKIVAAETGLDLRLVREYVKYDQLVPELKKLVDDGKVDVRVALQAQRAATTVDGDIDHEAAGKFVQEIGPMTDIQRKQFVKIAESDPAASVEEKIEKGRKQPKLKQIVVTLEPELHRRLQSFAQNAGMTIDEAAAGLLEQGLTTAE